eukprot:CCRYP_009308-RA/>CCRYP_009308-RA protein AED:0.26 eAED:0.26 QI:0/-1/0/1/-1/1/1/0/184
MSPLASRPVHEGRGMRVPAQYDLSKMPLCRHGDRCKVKDCPFRHISEADRLECVFYSQGFCIHGPFFRYKHVRRERADLPMAADFTLGLSQMQVEKDGMTVRRPAPKHHEVVNITTISIVPCTVLFLQPNAQYNFSCYAQQIAAALIGQQCGALGYMIEYRRGVETGGMNVVAPPIALPPRKIG